MPTAFLRKPFKSVCVDTVLFFAMFALVGHTTINYWERYTIQNELYTLKHSLHSLKDTIGNIGKAYDNLHNELKALTFEVDKKHMDTPECRQKAKLEAKCKAENFDRKRRDFEIQTVITNPDKIFGADFEMESANNKSHSHENKATTPLGINAATNTRNPLKSTGSPPSDTSTTEQGHARYYKDHINSRHVCHKAETSSRKL